MLDHSFLRDGLRGKARGSHTRQVIAEHAAHSPQSGNVAVQGGPVEVQYVTAADGARNDFAPRPGTIAGAARKVEKAANLADGLGGPLDQFLVGNLQSQPGIDVRR